MAKKPVIPTFAVGAQVTWSSQAGGNTTTKTGEVVAIVPPKTQPNVWKLAEKHGGISEYGGGMSRPHVSYIVMVKPTPKSKPRLYWPLANKLQAVEAKKEA